MMTASWQGLLQNLAILAILVSIWTHGLDWLEGKPRWRYEAFGCVLTGCGVVLVMMAPFEVRPGITTDLRSALIGLAGFLGSPLIGVVTGVIAAAYRIHFGGIGATPGVVSIAIATLVGIAGARLRRGRPATARDLLAFAAVCSVLPLTGSLVLPPSILLPVLAGSAVPLAAMSFVATMLAGLAVIEADRRREVATANLFYRGIIDALPEPLNAKDLDGRFLAANPATAAQVKAPDVAALIGKTDFDLHPEEAARRYRADEERVLATGTAETIEQVLTRADGTPMWLSTLKVPLRDRSGRIIGLLTQNHDISERKRMEDEVAAGRQRLKEATEYMADGLVMFDRDARIILCNEHFRAMFPLTADVRVPGARLADIMRISVARGERTDVPAGAVDAWIERNLASLTLPAEHDIRLADGRWIVARRRPTSDGGALAVLVDVTESKQAEAALTEANERLKNIASEDGLTGLTNRRAYDNALERACAQSRRDGTPLSLLFVDVDHFKAYNDTYGHPAGDNCLRTIGNLLRLNVRRPSDLTARYGGEEFAAILPDTPAEGAMKLAETVRQSILGLGMEHTGTRFGVVTVSIGVATMEAVGSAGPKDLTARADEALYAAKAAGRNRTMFAEKPLPMAANG